MKLKLRILLIITIFVVTMQAQERKNSIGFEFGGGGLAYSINYERHINEKFISRIGFSFLNITERQTEKTLTVMSYPISVSYLINLSGQKHFLETGIGAMNLFTTGDLVEFKGVSNIFLNPFVNLGYRFASTSNPLIYKIGLSPFLGTKSLTNPSSQGFQLFGSESQIWGYVGLGYRF
jgi:hypothetical protein